MFRKKLDLSVLLVCTANICRSPMAEALLRDHLKAKGLDRRVKVASAGIRAMAGMPPDPRALAAL
ncbi:MAG: low molecular weight phosphotyrosine protein phosphatase, partial [Gammaproteobacteria bacterium]